MSSTDEFRNKILAETLGDSEPGAQSKKKEEPSSTTKPSSDKIQEILRGATISAAQLTNISAAYPQGTITAGTYYMPMVNPGQTVSPMMTISYTPDQPKAAVKNTTETIAELTKSVENMTRVLGGIQKAFERLHAVVEEMDETLLMTQGMAHVGVCLAMGVQPDEMDKLEELIDFGDEEDLDPSKIYKTYVATIQAMLEGGEKKE